MADDPATAIIGAMTPEQKLRAAVQLYWSARELKAAGFRFQHPEWSEEQVKAAVLEAFLFHHEYLFALFIERFEAAAWRRW
jgi:hypothetical protein